MSQLPQHPMEILLKWTDRFVTPRVMGFAERHPRTADVVFESLLKLDALENRLDKTARGLAFKCGAKVAATAGRLGPKAMKFVDGLTTYIER